MLLFFVFVFNYLFLLLLDIHRLIKGSSHHLSLEVNERLGSWFSACLLYLHGVLALETGVR